MKLNDNDLDLLYEINNELSVINAIIYSNDRSAHDSNTQIKNQMADIGDLIRSLILLYKLNSKSPQLTQSFYPIIINRLSYVVDNYRGSDETTLKYQVKIIIKYLAEIEV